MHDEVLGGCLCAARQARAVDADQFDGQASGRGHLVVENVAGVGREAHDHRKGAGRGKGTLCQRLGQVAVYLNLAVEQAVSLGVHTANGVPRVLISGFEDGVHGFDQLFAGLRFIVRNDFK